MRLKKLSLLVAGTAAACFLLSGCSQIDTYVEQQINQQAQETIEQKDEYHVYEQYQEEGLLDDNGTYRTELVNDTDQNMQRDEQRQVLVTIAQNSFLNCTYQINGTEILKDDFVYLTPGESISVSKVSEKNSVSNLYAFSEFRVWSYDSDGNLEKKPYAEFSSTEGILLTIPENYTGSGFMIEPIGAYSDRTIEAVDYYINSNGKKQELNGSWTVDKKSFTGTTTISPTVSYTLVYDYERLKDAYYFDSCEPQCWYVNESEYKVIFQKADSDEQTSTYSVKMHPFIQLNIVDDSKSFLEDAFDKVSFWNTDSHIQLGVTRNGENLSYNTNNDIYTVKKLCEGDVLLIQIDDTYQLTGSGFNVGTPSHLTTKDGKELYEYKVIVPETDNTAIEIDVTKRNSNREATYDGYNVENAELHLYRSNGREIFPGDELPSDDAKVTVVIKANDGYYISGSGVSEPYSEYRAEKKFSDFQKNALKIIDQHQAHKYISVYLNKEDVSGTCSYKVDGKACSDRVSLRVGQKLEITFTANSQYTIVRSGILGTVENTWGSVTGQKNKISATISVTEDMDGKTITRSFFGIQVEKGQK